MPDNGTDLSSLAGVGIGLPGVMDERSGGLPSVPALGWPAEDIRPWITREQAGPVVLKVLLPS